MCNLTQNSQTMEDNAIRDINENLFFMFTKGIIKSKDFKKFVKSKRKYQTEAKQINDIVNRFSDFLQDLTEFLQIKNSVMIKDLKEK